MLFAKNILMAIRLPAGTPMGRSDPKSLKLLLLAFQAGRELFSDVLLTLREIDESQRVKRRGQANTGEDL
ncbi:MAG: hypothetical protein ABSD38_12555 [Syntrophorhabdales bacterium]|jgi:hypothetical protein